MYANINLYLSDLPEEKQKKTAAQSGQGWRWKDRPAGIQNTLPKEINFSPFNRLHFVIIGWLKIC